MTRKTVLWLSFWIVSLLIARYASSQSRSEAGQIISGENIGFRLDGWNGASRTGTLVVRVDGKWIDALPSAKPILVR
jgi:hypothetical protein